MMTPTITNEAAAGTGSPSVEDDRTTNVLTVDPAALPDPAKEHDLGRPISPDGVADIARVQDIESATNNDASTDHAPPQQDGTVSAAVAADPSSARRAKRLYLYLPVIIEYRFLIGQSLLLFALLLVVLTDDSLNGATEMERPLYIYDPSANDNHHPSPETRAEQPQWFRTTQPQYQQLFADHETMLEGLTAGDDTAGDAFHSSHALAGVFCRARNLGLCAYDAYCPRGRGHPGAGGRDVDGSVHAWGAVAAVQWAPFAPAPEGTSAATSWVQVGTVPESDAGGEDNNYGQCWTWDAWTGGRGDGNIEVEWGEDHRRWILCCDKKEI